MSVTIDDIEKAIQKLRKQRREILQLRQLVRHYPKHVELGHLQIENNQLSVEMRLEMLRQLKERKKHKKRPPGGARGGTV
jgi:hypothetical protein